MGMKNWTGALVACAALGMGCGDVASTPGGKADADVAPGGSGGGGGEQPGGSGAGGAGGDQPGGGGGFQPGGNGGEQPGGSGGTGGAAPKPDAGRPPEPDAGAGGDVPVPDAGAGGDVPVPDAGAGGETPTPDAGAGGEVPLPDLGVPPTPDNQDGDPFTVGDGDCDDLDRTVYPGAPELCDGRDNDCDGEVDGQTISCYEGDPAFIGIGLCHPGTSTCTAGEFGPCENQGLPAPEACGDALDDDCDGEADEGCDGDGDGVTAAAGDCDDTDGTVYPGADELCDALDNDCDGAVDGLTQPCYGGPAGTEGVGLCHGGVAVCLDGLFGDCEGQVLPAAAESCADETDDTCDGQVDEGCIVDPACAAIDLDSPVTLTSECVAVGGGAIPLVRIDLRDTNGAPLANRQVDIQFQPALPLAFRNVLSNGGTYYRGFNAGNAPQESRVNVTVACGAQRVTLRAHPVVQVVPGVVPGSHVVTGGCPLQGDVRALVRDAATGAPVPNAWIMAGVGPVDRIQPNAGDAIRGIPGNSVAAAVDPDGNPVLHDYGDLLDGPATVTVGAEGYENVTLAGVDASVIAVPLRVLNPPAPAAAEVSGRLSDFDSLRVDGRLDGGLVMPSIDLGFLGTFRTERLFSRSQCWDPLTEGLAADLIDPLDLPGNLYIPAQREGLVLLPVPVAEHRFTLNSQPLGRDDLVALTGKLPMAELLDLISNGGSLEEIVPLFDLTEIGVARNLQVDGPIPDLRIPMSGSLNENATCRVSNAPAGASVLCVSAGDWSGANGAGRLFPMGFRIIPGADLRGAAGPVEIGLPTVAPEGVFRGIGYVAGAVALFLDGADAPEGQAGGVSAVLDRRGLGPAGGTAVAESFFDVPSLTRDGLAISWGAVESATSPRADVCKVEIVRFLRTEYDPGECAGNRTEEREVPVWTAYTAGDSGTLVLPEVHDLWPRAAADGLIDTNQTPENDRLAYRISCMGLGLAPNFSFHRGNFRALTDGLTHVATQERGY
jgi:hypothetical protein